jgi:hypothetical protein
MKTVVTLFVYSKNLNLHAVSALEAIHGLLNEKNVHSINRYVEWTLTFNEGEEKALSSLKSLLSQSFYVLNPNKEDYFLNSVPSSKTHLQRFVRIQREFDNDQTNLKDLLNTRFSANLLSLKKSYVWDVKCDLKCSIDSVLDKIVVSSSSENGILVNPIYESFEILETL